MLTQTELLRLIQEHTARYPTQWEAAAALRISPAYLCDVLRGKRDISPRLAHVLGYRREFRFVPLAPTGTTRPPEGA